MQLWLLQQTSCRVSYGFYAKCSGEVLFDSGSVEVVLVVSGRCHDKEAVGKVGAVLEISDDMRDQCVEVSCNKPVNLCLSVPQYKLESWWSVGDASRCEAAKFPPVYRANFVMVCFTIKQLALLGPLQGQCFTALRK